MTLESIKENESHSSSITFLDLEIVRKGEGCIIKHFVKQTQTDRIIYFNSAHPKSVFTGIIKGEVNRSLGNCTLNSDRRVENAV